MDGLDDRNSVELGQSFACVVTPSDRNEWATAFRECLQDRIGHFFPTASAMAARVADLDCHTTVEKQNALFSPSAQVSACGHFSARVGGEFFENVDKTWRKRANIRLNAESQTHRMAGTRIGVLAEHDYLHVVERQTESP